MTLTIALTGMLFLATTLNPALANQPPKVLFTGAWSKTVTDTAGVAVRGRLVIGEKPSRDGLREIVVFVELQDATQSVGRSLRLYCEMSKTDFRPEYKGGLNCELRDKRKKPLQSTSFPFSGAVPSSLWVTLPNEGTIRLRATPFGIRRKGALCICPHLGQQWIIPESDPGPYFLSGTFTINPKTDRRETKEGYYVWRGTLSLPAVRIENRRK